MYGGKSMADIKEILSSAGIEIPNDKYEDFDKEFRKSYKSQAELNKLKEKSEMLEKQLNDANTTIASFKELDVESIRKQAEDWKSKYEKAEQDYSKKLYKNALQNKFNSIKFSSNSARDMIFDKALSSDIKFENDEIKGFDEFIKSIKENDPAAFYDEEQSQPSFTRPISKASKITGDPSKMDFQTYKLWRSENF